MVALITKDYFDQMPLGLKTQMKPAAEVIEEFINIASEQVEAYCDRKFALQSHTEVIYGSSSNKLMVDQYPLVSVESIAFEDYFGGSNEVATDLIRIHPSGILEWKFPLFRGPWRSDYIYTIEYTAGFDPIPGPIRQATALWTTELMRPNYLGPQPERAAELVPLSSEQIIDLLEHYRRQRIG